MGILNTQLSRLVASTLLLLVWSSSLGGQTYDLLVQIKDVSGPNSPIKGSGQASFHQELSADSVKQRSKIEARLVNVSNKTILAYEVSIEAIPDQGGGMRQTEQADYFFRSELAFRPGVQETMEYAPSSWSETSNKGGAEPVTPKATLEVVFVQFADGSRFGSSPWGSALSAVRKQTIEQLQLVLEGFRNSGEKGLDLALAKSRGRQENPVFTNVALDDIKETLKSSGPAAAAVRITGLLDAAQKRSSVM